MSPPHTPSNRVKSLHGPLAETLGCPPATLAELGSIDRERQQQLAAMIVACQQRQQREQDNALRNALPRFLHPLLGTSSGVES